MTSDTDITRIWAAMAKDPLVFGRMVAGGPGGALGGYYDMPSGPVHRAMINDVNDPANQGKILVIESFRGVAKTLNVSTINSFHRGIFPKPGLGRVSYIVIISYSNKKAAQIVSDFVKIGQGENFQNIFPGTVFELEQKDEIVISNKKFGFRFCVTARGRESQMTGLRFEEFRPQLVLCDDMEDPKEAYNQDIVDENVRYVNEVLRPGLDPRYGSICIIGTPFATDCTTQRFAKYPKGVRYIKYPVLVDDNMVPGMGKKLGLAQGHSVWEARFPTKKMEEEMDENIANGTIDSWMRQMMLDARASGDVRIPTEKIRRADLDSLFDESGEARRPLNVFIMADFAYSKSVWADESAIVVKAIDNESNHYYLYSDKGKWGDIGTTERIVQQALKYRKYLRQVGVESRGMGFIERRLLEVKRENNLSFGVVELKPKNRTKAERIRGMISLFDDGRIVLIGAHPKLEAEWARFRGEELRHGDDLEDADAYSLDIGYRPQLGDDPEVKQKRDNHAAFEALAESIWRDNRAPGLNGRVSESSRYGSDSDY